MKKLEMRTLLKDHAIPFSTTGSKHNAPGWINVHCPFCPGPQDYHLGFHEKKEYWNCWRCGGKRVDEVVSILLSISVNEAKTIIKQYRTGRPVAKAAEAEVKKASRVVLPGVSLTSTTSARRAKPGQISTLGENGVVDTSPHWNYLKKRGFSNPQGLIESYNLYGTGLTGEYNFRVIAPIYFDGELVSYQGRDYTGKSRLKYKACAKANEVRDHKNCLYAMDLVPGDTVVVVEGIVDVWKLGCGATATFGSTFTLAQVKLLEQRWKRRIILYDRDALVQAHKLANALSAFPGKTCIALLDGYKDPGELEEETAKEVMRDLLR